MAIFAKSRYALFLVAALVSTFVSANETITLKQAESIALQRDALTKAYLSQQDAYRQQSIAADTLPDPKIKIGLMNLPTDTFKLNQEPMTQTQVGIQQMFPAGDSLALKSERAISMSNMARARVHQQERIIRRELRQTWLEYLYWLSAKQVVRQNRNLFTELVEVTRQQYAAGRQRQQDVVRSELELGMLDDRATRIETQLEVTVTKLVKLLGDDFAIESINPNLPVFQLPEIKQEWLDSHPVMQMQSAMVRTSETNVMLAKQGYKPSWMLDITYGNRQDAANGAKRADFLSAMVMVDLPLFTGDRQDKQVAAKKSLLMSTQSRYEEKKRDLNKMWQANQQKIKRLTDRVKQYRTVLVPKAKQNKEASLYAYQSGRGNFTTLMRAQIMELETQLKGLRLQVDLAQSQAMLIYLAGEKS